MRLVITGLAILAAFLFTVTHSTSAVVASTGNSKMRTFLFIGEPNAAAWKFMIENPADRQKAAEEGIKKLGGKILSYHWGLGTGRNYIIIQMPDDIELIQANYLTRLGDGLLTSYKMIELMSSEAMVAALKRVPEVKAVDDLK